MRLWPIPEGLSIAPDGTWRVGDVPVVHERSLRWLESHLAFEDDGACVADGPRRLPVRVEGPAFVVTRVLLDAGSGAARALLDDGSDEPIGDDSLALDAVTGRFDCRVRGGRARARLSRAAQQRLLENVAEEAGGFALRVGPRRLALRT